MDSGGKRSWKRWLFEDWHKWPPAVSLVFVVLLIGSDMLADLNSGASLEHIVTEGAIISVTILGVVSAWIGGIIYYKKQLDDSNYFLGETTMEAQYWKEEATQLLAGLGEAIDRQFARWNLTLSEKEVGLMLLKGLSLREAARAREVSEKTVKQQSLSVYRKSGLSGRAELAAFFLEDLLLPFSALNIGEMDEPNRQPPVR